MTKVFETAYKHISLITGEDEQYIRYIARHKITGTKLLDLVTVHKVRSMAGLGCNLCEKKHECAKLPTIRVILRKLGPVRTEQLKKVDGFIEDDL